MVQRMKIQTTQVTKYKLTELEALDPVSVICEDLGPRQGKIIIECFGESWSAYWGGMGQRNIVEFFCSCNEHYLAKNLSSIDSSVPDYDNLDQWLKSSIIKGRRDREFEKSEARELFDEVSLWCENDERFLHSETGHRLCVKVIGDEWWYCIPTKPNHEYEYLCRIINAVKDALKTTIQDKAA